MHPPKQDVEHRIESLESQLKDAFAEIEALKSAQSGAQDVTFGEITCRGLNVVDGKRSLVMAYLTTNEHGGVVHVCDKGGKSGAQLFTDEYGGAVLAIGKNGGQAVLNIDEHGGTVGAIGKNGDYGAQLRVDEGGGVVAATGEDGGEAQMAITEDGGEITAIGKDG